MGHPAFIAIPMLDDETVMHTGPARTARVLVEELRTLRARSTLTARAQDTKGNSGRYLWGTPTEFRFAASYTSRRGVLTS
jgi:hypothetical protein